MGGQGLHHDHVGATARLRPYKIKSFEAGRFVVVERVKDYWGKDLAVHKGNYNFDTIRFDYYRDNTIALEAFKAGEYDYRSENSSKAWATAYNFKAVGQGLIRGKKSPTTAHRACRPSSSTRAATY